jgi:hypothetical protein
MEEPKRGKRQKFKKLGHHSDKISGSLSYGTTCRATRKGASFETTLCLVNSDITAKAFAEASQPKQRGLYLVATAVIGA